MDLDRLAAGGLLEGPALEAARRVASRYAVRLTPLMLRRATEHDGVSRQFVPHPDELTTTPEERADPIGDAAHSPVPGLVHRYPDRVLLKPVHVCPVYCRFCFRREVVGPTGEGVLSAAELEVAYDYVRERPAIWEVILTGGDPMVLSAARLRAIASALAAIPHVSVLRLHTRVPVVDPTAVTTAKVDALKHPGITPWVVVHTNHPDEFGPEAEAALACLVDRGVPLLSQTVLLRGVNDDADVLDALFRRLVSLRVKPYYLHHPDLAPGTARFRLTLDEGRALDDALLARTSGLCRPTYVLDIPGGHGKIPAARARLQKADGDAWRAESPTGTHHPYPPRGEG